jgi:hypothetical protein
MKTFMNLQGDALTNARILCILLPAFFLFGFNQSNLGGCLAYPSFIKHFPTINTATTKGGIKAENSRIQGAYAKIRRVLDPVVFCDSLCERVY